MAKLSSGGQVESLTKDKKVTEIKIGCDDKTIMLMINDSSLSYLSIAEAIEMRDELNRALKQAVGV